MSTIRDLVTSRGLLATCPNCDETFPLRDAHLFDAAKRLPPAAMAHIQTEKSAISEALSQIGATRRELRRRSATSAESTGVGQVVEMLSPSLPGFPIRPSDCRALLKPIDYVGFKGLTSTGAVDAVMFIEVKSGRQQLSKEQRQVKRIVEEGKVRFVVADHAIAATR